MFGIISDKKYEKNTLQRKLIGCSKNQIRTTPEKQKKGLDKALRKIREHSEESTGVFFCPAEQNEDIWPRNTQFLEPRNNLP